jgi:hypothetical protein
MRRLRRALVPTLVPALGLALAAVVPGGAHAAGGPVGKSITLKSGVTLSGYDAATTKDGTTYVGWIGDDANNPNLRQLHLCVLKLSSKSCVGGVQTADALGSSSAQNVKVVVTGGQVELVWIAQVAPGSGEFSGVFGTNTVSHGTLGASVAVPGAPTLGALTSAIAHRGGGVSLAAVGEVGTLDQRAYYYPTVSATPATLKRPYFIGNAQLADNGKQTVLTTSAYGSISGKVAVAFKSSNGTHWGSFKNVATSYTAGGLERLVTAGGHIRMVGVSAKAIYTPDSWTWNGTSFGKPKPSGDHNDIFSLDTATDASGRLVSIGNESGGLAVSNFGKGSHASRFLFTVKQTLAGGPAQISTSTSGRGFIVWGIEKTGVTGQILKAQAIRLSALTRTVHKNGHAGRVSLTGPASCLPATTVHLGVKGKPARGWKVASRTMHLGSKKQGGSLNGARLKAHHSYTLKGTVVFAKGGTHSSVTASLKFTTCGRP